MIRCLLALFICLPSIAAAATIHHFSAQEQVTLQPDTAYILYRSNFIPRGQHFGIVIGVKQFDFVLVRAKAISSLAGASLPAAPDQPERSAAIDTITPADMLVFRTDARKAFENGSEQPTYFAALPPGRYVIVGAASSGFGFAGTCFCMGSVSFEAKAGVVTDLGYLLATWDDRPSTIPELAPYVEPSKRYVVMPPIIIATVRPPADATPVPAALQAMPRIPADLRAVGKIPNYFHTVINRMAPIPGVLAYDGDTVIDLKLH